MAPVETEYYDLVSALVSRQLEMHRKGLIGVAFMFNLAWSTLRCRRQCS